MSWIESFLLITGLVIFYRETYWKDPFEWSICESFQIIQKITWAVIDCSFSSIPTISWILNFVFKTTGKGETYLLSPFRALKQIACCYCSSEQLFNSAQQISKIVASSQIHLATCIFYRNFYVLFSKIGNGRLKLFRPEFFPVIYIEIGLLCALSCCSLKAG